MLAAARHHAVSHAGRSRREARGGAAVARTPAQLALSLQRSAGNRAVAGTLAPRMRIARTPQREPVLEPGTGFDGIWQHYGEVVSQKNLTEAQKQAVRDYRAWMESTFDTTAGYKRGDWAKEAGARAARFPGDAAARANVYAEMQRQIVHVTGGPRSDWIAMAERGADGSYIFRGNPDIAEPKVFVIDPEGNCYAGDAKKGLSGRGAGKQVNYDKLYKVGTVKPPTPTGGGGRTGGTTAPKTGEPAGKPPTGAGSKVTPTTGEPVTTGPKVEPATSGKPATTGGGARIGTGGATEGGKAPRISLRGAGGLVFTMAIFWWLGSRAEKAEAESLKEIMRAKVEPKVQEAFKATSTEAERINKQVPETKLHAIITVDFDYTWVAMGIGGTPSREHVTDARFVSLSFGNAMSKPKTTVLRHDKHTSLTGSDTYHDATRQVTWSVEIDFGETDQQRRYRAHLKAANEVIRKGWSARKAAQSQHFDRGPDRSPSRKDMENQKLGLPTEADTREMLDREMFVRAYIEMIQYYDADELLRDARAYLAELEGARKRDPYASRFVKKKPTPLEPFDPKVPAGSR